MSSERKYNAAADFLLRRTVTTVSLGVDKRISPITEERGKYQFFHGGCFLKPKGLCSVAARRILIRICGLGTTSKQYI